MKEYIEDVIRCHNELFSLESTVGSDLYTQGQNEWAIISDLYESKIRSNGQNEVAAKGLKNMMMVMIQLEFSHYGLALLWTSV